MQTTKSSDTAGSGEEEIVSPAARRYAWLSLVSVIVTALMITVNHIFALGAKAFGLGAVLIVVPAVLLWVFTRTRSRVALIGYLLMNVWIIVGFGWVKGLWEGALRLYVGTLLASLSTSFPRPVIGSFWFEVSGILTFVGSLFVLYYGYQLMRALHASPTAASGEWPLARKPLIAATSVLAAAVIIGAYVRGDRDSWVPPVNGVVKIAVIAPTGGPYAILGSSFVQAVRMAKEDLKATKYDYELLVRDPGPDPKKAVDVVRRVIEDDKADAVIGAVSLIGEVTKPFARKARIPHTCVCTVTPIGDGAYNFTNIPSPEAEAVRWVDEARRRGIKTLALFSQDYPSINNHVKALKAEAARAGLRITYESRFADSVADFRTRIGAGKASKPDVYYVEALSPALDKLGQQLSDADIHNIASVVAPSLSERPELFEGVWYTDSDLADPGFKRRFEDKYPDTRFATHMMPYAYDSFNMIVRAYESGVNPAVFIRRIAKYEGAAGVVTKNRGSGNFKSAPAVWMIRNGAPVLIDGASQVSKPLARGQDQ